MAALKNQRRRKAFFIGLAVLFAFSVFAVAADRHADGFSPTCPICHTLNSLNGTASAVVIEYHPAQAFHYSAEVRVTTALRATLPFENKAPPA